MLDKIKKVFQKKEDPKKKTKKKTPLDIATAAGEPYINVLSMDVNPENIQDGAFELEWNDIFLARLIKAGYQQAEDDTDAMIVDRWFQTVCRNVAQETYEQFQADPENRRNLGGGFTEVK
jgi:hypothetical protein